MSDLISTEIIDELCCRFIINVPGQAKTDIIRICFNIELALWFYIDFLYEKKSSQSQTIGMRDFARLIFNRIPSLQNKVDQLDAILLQWKDYKMTVPTYGGIVLDESKENVLLVQAYWPKTTWGFPKGKVNEGEPPHECAIREVLEETGLDIRPYLKEDEYIERQVHGQMARLYIICGVPMDIEFKPKTRNEIKAMQWFKICYLPCHKKDNTPKLHLNQSTNSFFMIIPFVKDLRKWITKTCIKNSRNNRNKTRDPSSKEEVFNDNKNKNKPIHSKQINPTPLDNLLSKEEQTSIPPDNRKLGGYLQSPSPQGNRIKKDKEKRSSNRTTYSPPPRMQKLRRQQQNQIGLKSDAVQILNRDGSVSGKNPTNTSSLFNDLENEYGYGIKLCSTWRNFRFDRQKIFNIL